MARLPRWLDPWSSRDKTLLQGIHESAFRMCPQGVHPRHSIPTNTTNTTKVRGSLSKAPPVKFFSPQALDKQAVLRRPLRHSGPERTRRRVRSERSSHPPCKNFSSPRIHSTLLEEESDKRRAYASPLHPTLGALPTNFDFDRQERAQAQRTLDNMKALPALGFTLKHDTVSSFVRASQPIANKITSGRW